MRIKALIISLLLVFEASASDTDCPTCLSEDMDRNSQKIEVQSGVVFNQDGEPICQVSLTEHSELVPSFAKTSTDKITNPNGPFQTERNLLPCTNEYLDHLKEVATNNIVINNDTSYIHKTSWAYMAGGAAACIVGLGLSIKDIYSAKIISMAGLFSALAGLSASSEAKQTTDQLEKIKKKPWIIHKKQRKILEKKMKTLENKIAGSKNTKVAGTALAVGSICYLGPKMGFVAYESYRDDIRSFIQKRRIQEYKHFYDFRKKRRRNM